MKNMGDGRRIARVEREVQAIVSTFIIQKLQRELPGLVTIGRVQIPADLRTAKVYVSMLNTQPESVKNETDISVASAQKALSQLEASIRILQSWAPDIQDEISDKLNMKYLPKLTFFADESTEKILKIEKIISQLNQQGRPAGSVHDDDLDDDDESFVDEADDDKSE